MKPRTTIAHPFRGQRCMGDRCQHLCACRLLRDHLQAWVIVALQAPVRDGQAPLPLLSSCFRMPQPSELGITPLGRSAGKPRLNPHPPLA
jgi:hypothetical protein